MINLLFCCLSLSFGSIVSFYDFCNFKIEIPSEIEIAQITNPLIYQSWKSAQVQLHCKKDFHIFEHMKRGLFGPDAFGYIADDADPSTFSSISGTGTLESTTSTSDNLVSAAIGIGFSFDFYGTLYTNVFISSNGFITFLPAQQNGCCNGGSIPSPSQPNGLISGWWTDLRPDTQGDIYYQTAGTSPNLRFTVEYNNVATDGATGSLNFQIVLHESGDIKIIYGACNPSNTVKVRTIGIENPGGTDGIQIYRSNSGAFPYSSQAIFINNPGGLGLVNVE